MAEDGSDQPLARWETDEVVELLRALGLDSRLLAAAIDPTGLRRLRFRGVQAPFLMLDDQDAVRGFASLMFVPMAANVLVEIEHGRVLVDPAAPLDPLAFHAMDAHTVWTAFLGDAQGLAPALGLRALSTIDRGLRAISRRAIALEAGIAQAVTSGFSDAEDETRVRALTRELLATTGVTGAVAGRLAASRDAGAGDRGRTAINHPYDRCMSELERLMDAVAARRDDLRAVAKTAADAATMLGLMEQQIQGRRTSRLQRTITLLATVVLLPGLVASIYGANIAVPGRDRTAGTVVLVGAMLAIGAVSAWLVGALDRERPEAGWFQPPRQRWLIAFAALTAAASVVIAALNA